VTSSEPPLTFDQWRVALTVCNAFTDTRNAPVDAPIFSARVAVAATPGLEPVSVFREIAGMIFDAAGSGWRRGSKSGPGRRWGEGSGL